MTTTQQDDLLINDLVNIAWQVGAVKSPQMAQRIEQLRAKLAPPPPPKTEEKKPEGKGK